ncbi:MAG: DUF2809 domain-containing protein [Psychroserpens sp.]|uniref:ribosomal maturation YjgA family protein n=1 Tax=Psychroserpens sp. TaxID=2020870 RepID=UPI003CB9B927
MKIRFHSMFFASALFLLAVEIIIALYLSAGFIRHTVGDFLVVILMYCSMRAISNIKAISCAIMVLSFSFLIEFLQLFNLLDVLDLRNNNLAVIILGSTFEISDLIAYTFGAITIYLIDVKLIRTTH